MNPAPTRSHSAARWLLGFSLAANVALLSALVASRSSIPNLPAGAREGGSVAANTAPSHKVPPPAYASRPSSSPSRPTPTLWSRLRSDNLEELVRQLRAAGFPPSAVRSIIMELVVDSNAARRRELFGTPAVTPYWQVPDSRITDPKKVEELTELARQENALLKKLLGPEFWLNEDTNPGARERRYGNLPADKIAALQAIRSDYSDMFDEAIRAAGKNDPAADADFRKKHRLLQEAERADMAKLLSPAELFEYDLRNSGEAWLLVNDTSAFQPTEAEFRALFPLYQAAGQQAQSQLPATASRADFEAAYRIADEKAQPQIKDLLGPERYSDYLQAKDPASEKLNKIVQRLDLPLSAATAVVAVQKDITQRADAVKADPSLTSEQRQAQLAALAQEAATKITTTLGTRGFGAYRQYSGRWLQALQPKSGSGRR